MLTLLIPGPKAPGKDIDVFLRSLVNELKELWSGGIDTRDTKTNNRSVFRMRTVLSWTINNFHREVVFGVGAVRGTSVILMPFFVYKRLGLGEVKVMTMSLQLDDKSIKHPLGVVEDVIIKVDKFIFPVDFIVLDIEEDQDIPIILGRPFLATSRALIDVKKDELILRVQDDERAVCSM
ncbi:RNA-directed DNA polymerase [Abeliophyllum distichum]|uniref:RNA-directed DNA polymerase n=1 Tax=Abeliophyllum distichum TaxID=126358 RepID=A0ABD1RFT5_9LAMI